MSNKLPIIEQLHNAGSDRERARILLQVSDAILLKYGPVFLDACRQFDAGYAYVVQRRAALNRVRTLEGLLPDETALALQDARRQLHALAIAAPPSIDL